MSAWTFLFASLVLLPFLMWERRRGRTQGTNDRRPWTGSGVGFFGVGRDPVVGVECRAHLFDSANPNLTALLASVILSERMSLVRWASLSVSLVGVLILSGFDWRHLQLANSKYLFGNVLLLACASSSFYNVYCKELLRGFTPLEVLIYGYVLAFVASVPRVAWVEHFSLLAIRDFRASTWLALIVLSALSWGLAMVLWMFLLKRLDVSQGSVSIYLLPFLGVLISAVTLKEKNNDWHACRRSGNLGGNDFDHGY